MLFPYLKWTQFYINYDKVNLALFATQLLTISRANVIIGNIQNLPIGWLMLQCVTSIKKFTKNTVILRL